MPTAIEYLSRAWPLAMAGLIALAPPAPAAEPAATRPLAWMLEPGEVRELGIELELDTQMTVTRGGVISRRNTSTVASFRVNSIGLRRRKADQYVVERRVQNFQLAVLTTADGATLEVTMDNDGLTLRQGREREHRVPWANVPRGRGGEIGELIGRAVTCTINRFGIAVQVDERMAPWQRVLDSMDLTPLLLPMVPVPDAAVSPGQTWTFPGELQAHTVQLSRPWGTLQLGTRTEVKLLGFERRGGRAVARLSFVATTKPTEEQVRLTYELTIRGQIVLGLDGAVADGEAHVTLAASAAVVDAVYKLAGTGTLRFTGPDRPGAAPPETSGTHEVHYAEPAPDAAS